MAASQRRSNCMVPPHVRQSTSERAEAFPISVWQLEQRRIDASQEIVVTTTTLTLRLSDLRRKKFHRESTVLSASAIRLGCTSGLPKTFTPQLWAGGALHVGHVTASARSFIFGIFGIFGRRWPAMAFTQIQTAP
jgi:hypothetical protein